VEQSAIHESCIALDRLLKRLGLPSIDIPEDRIHVLTKREFREKVSGRAEAKSSLGHVYVPRQTDPVEFSTFLTHELSHAASRYNLQVIQKEDPRQLHVWERRMGLMFQPRGANDPKFEVFFGGLNEGVTEYCAKLLREDVATRQSGLDETERERLQRATEYRSWVHVVDEMLKLVAKEEGVSYADLREELLRDHFAGTYRFLRRLERCRKGAVKALRSLESDPESALTAARALGLDETGWRMPDSVDPSGS